MISNVLTFIASKIHEQNPFFEVFHAAAFKSIAGNVVCGVGFDKQDVGISDISGSGLYIRINGPVSFLVPTRRFTSCNTSVQVSVPVRLVLYSFLPQVVDPFGLEAKIRQDILQLDWSGYVGTEKKILPKNIQAVIHLEEALKNELLPGLIRGMAGEDISQVITNFPTALAYWDFTLEFLDPSGQCVACDDIFCTDNN